MSDKSSGSSGGVGVLGLLGVVFVTLELCGVIAWSWWWVTAPFWLPIVLLAFLFGGFLLYLTIANRPEIEAFRR